MSHITPEIQKELDIITEAVLAEVPAEEIYLFGSYAYGTPHKDSDLDIYVVVPDCDLDILNVIFDIRVSSYEKRNMPLDLLIVKKSTFDRRKISPTVENIIYNEGIKIYSKQ